MGTENTHRVESIPENVDWGAFDPDRDPVLEVSPGATVEIETVTPPRPGHRETLTSAGVDADDILADELAVAETVSHEYKEEAHGLSRGRNPTSLEPTHE